jgi:hypothetical protein
MAELGQLNHSKFLVRYSIFLGALGVHIILELPAAKNMAEQLQKASVIHS